MTPVHACLQKNFLTSTPHSLLGGIVSNVQGLRTTTDAYLWGKNEWYRILSTENHLFLTVVSSRPTRVVYGCLAYILYLWNIKLEKWINFLVFYFRFKLPICSARRTTEQYSCIRLGFLPFSPVLKNLILHLRGVRWLSCFEWNHVILPIWMNL